MTDPKPFVSPYLRRPLRSYGEAMRDLARRPPQAEPRVQSPEDGHALGHENAKGPSSGPADR
jgi:hypothetical protein